jgi:hypothetical protein
MKIYRVILKLFHTYILTAINGGRSVGIVHLRTKATEFSLV